MEGIIITAAMEEARRRGGYLIYRWNDRKYGIYPEMIRRSKIIKKSNISKTTEVQWNSMDRTIVDIANSKQYPLPEENSRKRTIEDVEGDVDLPSSKVPRKEDE